MRKIVLLIFIISFSNFAQNTSLKQKFDSVLAAYKSNDKTGLVAGVLQNGNLIYLKGFGVSDIETKTPITPKTKFLVEDLGKQFAVLSILLLEQQGKLSLEDDIRKYLTYLPEYKHVVRIKHLLHHTSGMHTLQPLKELLNIQQNHVFTHDDAVSIISSQQELNFKPGTQFSYHTSDTEIILLVEITEKVSKLSFQDFTKKNLFEPMKMTNTSFNNSRSLLTSLAKSYAINDVTTHNPINDLILGANNLYTTGEDFAKFYQYFYTDKKLSSLVKKLDGYVKLDSGKEFNSTWGKVTLGRYFDHPERGLPKMAWQFGLTGGYGANLFRYYSHNVITFVLGNNNRYNGMPAGNLGTVMMEKEFTEPPEIDYSKIKFKDISTRKLKKFEGNYWNKTNSLVRNIYVRNDTLRYKRLNGNRETALLPITDNKFQFYVRGDTELFLTFNDKSFAFSSLNSDASIYEKVDLIDDSKVNLNDFVGDYYSKEYDVVLYFSIKENKLILSNLKTSDITFYPIVKDAFRSNTYMYSGIQFTRKDGVIDGFNINTDGVVNLEFTKI